MSDQITKHFNDLTAIIYIYDPGGSPVLFSSDCFMNNVSLSYTVITNRRPVTGRPAKKITQSKGDPSLNVTSLFISKALAGGFNDILECGAKLKIELILQSDCTTGPIPVPEKYTLDQAVVSSHSVSGTDDESVEYSIAFEAETLA